MTSAHVLTVIRRFDGVTFRELAEALGIPDGDTVERQRLSQKLGRMRRAKTVTATGNPTAMVYRAAPKLRG